MTSSLGLEIIKKGIHFHRTRDALHLVSRQSKMCNLSTIEFHASQFGLMLMETSSDVIEYFLRRDTGIRFNGIKSNRKKGIRSNGLRSKGITANKRSNGETFIRNKIWCIESSTKGHLTFHGKNERQNQLTLEIFHDQWIPLSSLNAKMSTFCISESDLWETDPKELTSRIWIFTSAVYFLKGFNGYSENSQKNHKNSDYNPINVLSRIWFWKH